MFPKFLFTRLMQVIISIERLLLFTLSKLKRSWALNSGFTGKRDSSGLKKKKNKQSSKKQTNILTHHPKGQLKGLAQCLKIVSTHCLVNYFLVGVTHPLVTIQLFLGYLDILPQFLPKQMAFSCLTAIIKKEQAYLHSSTLHIDIYFVNALDIVETKQKISFMWARLILILWLFRMRSS